MTRRALAILIPLCAVAFMVPAGRRGPAPRFATAREALDYVAARIQAVAPDVDAGDAYASTLFQTRIGLDGRPRLHVLVRPAAEELALAESFLAHGFAREAAAHLDNLLHYHAESREGARARALRPRVRPPTIAELVEPGAAVVEDARGDRFVAGKAARSAPPTDERPHPPYLEPAAPAPPLKAVGRIDEEGRIASGGGLVGDGAYYRLPPGARTLEEAERAAKLAILKDPAARAYAGERTGQGPLPDDVARFRQSADGSPRLLLTGPSGLARDGVVELAVDARGIDAVTFSFARLEGPFPALEGELRKWLPTAPARPSHAVRLPVEKVLRLPVEPGAWRVTAEAAGLRGDFVVVRPTASLRTLAVPGETVVWGDRPGLSLSIDGALLGTTGADGRLVEVKAKPVLPRFCAEHVECCRGCESCHHHHEDGGLRDGARVLVSGGGAFYRAVAKMERGDLPSAPPSGPLLLVYTDRSVYKAGDTLRFRGIARAPRAPLGLDAPSRLVPAVELPVDVRLESGKTVLFSRAYVTGEHGTFHGEVPLPLSMARAEVSLKVATGGVESECAVEVQDYRKTDFRVALTPQAGGVRVEAGYVWGGAVEGAALRATVDGRPAEVVDGRIAAAAGARVHVVLARGEEELARASAVVRPSAPSTRAPLDSVDKAETPAADAAPRPSPPAGLRIRASKDVYGPGETIEVAIEGAGEAREAFVVVADATVYEARLVPLRDGRGTAAFPVRAIYDPGVAIYALCGERQARTDAAVRTQEMAAAIRAPATARPGERVEVVLVGAPRAAFSLAAVDDAVFALREDETPGLYGRFHPARPAGLAVGGFVNPEWDGPSLSLETPIDPSIAREGVLIDGRPHRAGAMMLLGGGGGGGGRYGSRMGGKRNLVARGGGGGDTDDSVLGGLRGLAKVQSPDGSWGDAATTGWALLSFLGAGYSHLSKDTYDNRVYGEVVRDALRWILRSPEPADVAAATALVEAYGLTGSVLFKDAAERAVQWVVRGQSADGGWGGLVESARAVMVLKSAQIAGLPVPAAAAQRAYAWFDAQPEGSSRAEIGAAMCARIWLRNDRTDPRLAAAAQTLLASPPVWADADPLGWYFASLALFQFDGPSGPCWKRWQPWIQQALVRNRAPDGTWTVGGERTRTTALAALTLQVYYRYANVFGAHGTGPDEESFRALPALAPPPRIRVTTPDTAFWAPELVADERGEARVSFALPDAVTTTRLTARGVADGGRVGEAVSRIAARPAFFVQLRAPEFACVGDVLEARVDVFAAEPTEAVVRLDGRSQRVRVEPGRPAVTFWTVKAEREGPLALRATAEAGGRSDGVERVVPVRGPGRESEIVVRGRTFAAPEGAREATLVLRPRRGSLPALLDGLRYLTEYPHGCTEQTLSRFVPNVLTAEALRRLGADTAAFEADFPAMMRQGVERVLAHQGPAGGWGWYAANPEDPWVTALAVQGLSEAARLGYAVDAVALKRGRERLRALVREAKDLDQKAFGARVLGEELEPLLEKRDGLSASGLAQLALGLKRAGRPEAADVAAALAARARNDHWDGGNARWGDPEVQATAVALEALAEIDPGHRLIPRAAKWLLDRREGTRWRSTRDTAAAITALLRADGAELAQAAMHVGPPVRIVKVAHNGGAPVERRLDLSNPLVSRSEAPLAVVPGENRLSIDAEDIDVEVRMKVVEPASAAVARGLSAAVDYDRPTSSLRVGDEVVATLHLEAADDAVYAMVSAPVPAGCELIGGSGEGPFQRFEARYEKALFFLDRLPKGRHALRYRMRCAFAGEFAVGPAYAGLMYDERVRGWGAETRMEISR